jgi:hypothetical protein
MVAKSLARGENRAMASTSETASRGTGEKIPFLGARKAAQRLQDELRTARESLQELGALDHAQIEKAISEKRLELETVERQVREAEQDLAAARQRIVMTEEAEILQEVGVYDYRHPLTDAAAYQAQLKRLNDQIKAMARADGGAVEGATDWTVNGSKAQGRKMIRETTKLMLRAYNAEADNLVRGLKPYKLASAIERLDKVQDVIERLGRTLSIRINPSYHALRVRELELTADFLAKKEEEKEREREERERLREERKVQQEIERERKRLEKERDHYLNAIAALAANEDTEAQERLQAELAEIERAMADVDYRAANMRAGYVYVISNVGAFGEDVVKVGLTRRLDPRERVRELGDASVPFRYDVHALHFSEDAVAIEQELHRRLDERRINRVNLRREFFRVTPAEVKAHLLELTGELLEFTDVPEALEYRQSLHVGNGASPDAVVAAATAAGVGQGAGDRDEAGSPASAERVTSDPAARAS